MEKLNDNNHLTWTHEFDKPVAIMRVTEDTQVMFSNETECHIFPLINDASSYGINERTVEIVQHDNPFRPPVWDPIARRIIYWPPRVVPGTTHVLQYRWKDMAGNQSAVGNINVDIQKSNVTFWQGRPSSYQCVVENGQRTGYAMYSILEEYDSVGGPLTTSWATGRTKANTPGDPDYIPPEFNFISCAPPQASAQLIYENHSFEVAILSIRFGTNSRWATLNHTSGDAQPGQMNIVPGVYDRVSVILEIMAYPQRFGIGLQAAGGTGIQSYKDIAPGPTTIDFANVTVDETGARLKVY